MKANNPSHRGRSNSAHSSSWTHGYCYKYPSERETPHGTLAYVCCLLPLPNLQLHGRHRTCMDATAYSRSSFESSKVSLCVTGCERYAPIRHSRHTGLCACKIQLLNGFAWGYASAPSIENPTAYSVISKTSCSFAFRLIPFGAIPFGCREETHSNATCK